jgi:hypothetical protein
MPKPIRAHWCCHDAHRDTLFTTRDVGPPSAVRSTISRTARNRRRDLWPCSRTAPRCARSPPAYCRPPSTMAARRRERETRRTQHHRCLPVVVRSGHVAGLPAGLTPPAPIAQQYRSVARQLRHQSEVPLYHALVGSAAIRPVGWYRVSSGVTAYPDAAGRAAAASRRWSGRRRGPRRCW